MISNTYYPKKSPLSNPSRLKYVWVIIGRNIKMKKCIRQVRKRSASM